MQKADWCIWMIGEPARKDVCWSRQIKQNFYLKVWFVWAGWYLIMNEEEAVELMNSRMN